MVLSQWNESEAATFLDSHYVEPGDAALGLRIAISTHQPPRAVNRLAHQAMAFLGQRLEEFENADLHDALARHARSTNDINAAVAHAKAITMLDVFAEVALHWPVQLRIDAALQESEERLGMLKRYRERIAHPLALALPGYRDNELNRAEVLLLRYKRKLHRIVQKHSIDVGTGDSD